MITLRHTIAIALALGLLACNKEDIKPVPECTAPDYSTHPRNNEFEDILNRYQHNNQLPAALIATRTGSGPVWIGATGWSNIERANTILPCTQFRTGSIAKAFIGTLALMLQEDGLIDLDDALSTRLPAAVGPIPHADRITLRMLLNHSSGLRHPSDDDVQYQLRIINDPEGMARLTVQQKLDTYVYGRPLLFEPGQGIHYSNAGYWLMQLVLERASGRTIDQLLSQRITGPLGLSNTYLARRDDPRIARGYNRQGDKLVDVTRYDRADSDNDPAGGIVSTADDLIRFGEALFGGQLLEPASLAEMKQVSTYPGGQAPEFVYGLGIETWTTPDGRNGYGKNGTLTGAEANWIHFEETGTSVVIFTNYGLGSNKDFIDDLFP
jgi:D-alanyl-D-alanine carboxypeptidase